MRVFLQGWPTYQGRSALALYGLIQRDSQIRDICRNPLLLTILTGLYLENRNFEFPTSRSLFYKAAIEELITKRPARREIKQKFEPADKWNVLQRVSLSRLETVQVNEDPEELTTDTFREQATAVFRGQIDFSEFIKELVELNGIIKPTSDGIYTCAHRTIQEYFAANEAGRIRTPDDVVLRFSDRQDLIEVLYFYCGMLKNIPQLTNIVEFFASDRRWLEASRCLLSMTEVPVASQVYRVTTELKAQIVSGTEFRPVLEILSSLAQRPEVEFDPARERFFEAVNYLAGGNRSRQLNLRKRAWSLVQVVHAGELPTRFRFLEVVDDDFIACGVRAGDGEVFGIVGIGFLVGFAEASRGVGLFVEELAISSPQIRFALDTGNAVRHADRKTRHRSDRFDVLVADGGLELLPEGVARVVTGQQ